MPKHLNRRAFLATGAVAALSLAVATEQPAGADTSITVYRLNAEWGYPVGPKGKTRCKCRACHGRAANTYFRTHDAAIAGRVHPCCVCQVYESTVAGVSSQQLFASGEIVDVRDPRIAAVFADVAAPATDPAAAPGSAPGAATAAMGFARTGTTLRLATVGAAVVGLGTALLAFRNRRTPAAATPSAAPRDDRERDEVVSAADRQPSHT